MIASWQKTRSARPSSVPTTGDPSVKIWRPDWQICKVVKKTAAVGLARLCQKRQSVFFDGARCYDCMTVSQGGGIEDWRLRRIKGRKQDERLSLHFGQLSTSACSR